jgi:hypothetical protein
VTLIADSDSETNYKQLPLAAVFTTIDNINGVSASGKSLVVPPNPVCSVTLE